MLKRFFLLGSVLGCALSMPSLWAPKKNETIETDARLLNQCATSQNEEKFSPEVKISMDLNRKHAKAKDGMGPKAPCFGCLPWVPAKKEDSGTVYKERTIAHRWNVYECTKWCLNPNLVAGLVSGASFALVAMLKGTDMCSLSDTEPMPAGNLTTSYDHSPMTNITQPLTVSSEDSSSFYCDYSQLPTWITATCFSSAALVYLGYHCVKRNRLNEMPVSEA